MKPFERNSFLVKKFQDFRGLDLSGKDFRNVPIAVLVTVDFDTETKWPARDRLPADFNPEVILENGKNPGLGLRDLHRQGITGKGVNVAIIDQKLDLNHSEYSANISSCEELGGSAKEDISMHGPAVASIFVGRNCGVAPEARLYYKTAPCGDMSNWDFQSQALNNIINHNSTVNDKDKIRVVSCSVGYPNSNFKGDLNIWINTIEKARKSGIIFIDSNTILKDLNFTGGGNLSDKENIDEYEGWLAIDENNKDRIIVPSDYRTFASSWNKKRKNGPDEYGFNCRGGISWSIPYLAGLFTLMLQVNRNLKFEEMVKIIRDTFITNKKGLQIVNPKGIIEAVKLRG